MVLDKAFTLGVAGNEISKQITRSSETALGRTIVTTTTGGLPGWPSVDTPGGVAAVFITAPLAAAAAVIAGGMSLFD